MARYAIVDVLIERSRQVKKWPPEHDDEHKDGAIGAVAAVLAHPDAPREPCGCREAMCPHVSFLPDPDPIAAPDWALPLRWKQPTRRHQLVVAAALCIAEIERIDRLTAPEPPATPPPPPRR